MVPPIADDDTPPPPERPLLRQPVGFAWNNSLSLSTAPSDLNTYQASLPVTASSSSAVFLPGQAVPSLPLPTPKSKSKGSRTKKSDGTSVKKRRIADYPGQTGRFRLPAYDPTPSTSPPIHHGQGPYSSMYRGTPSEATDRAVGVASPTPTLSSSGGHHVGPISSTPAPNFSTRSKDLSQSAAQRPKQTETWTKPSRGRVRASDAKAKPSGKSTASTSTRKTSAPVSSNNTPSVSLNGVSGSRSATSGGHYRHDYAGNMPESHHSSGSPSQSPLPEPHVANSGAISSTVGGSAADAVDPGARRVFRQLRMVTLLIQDLRSGVADHQLAEVKIRLTAADDPQDGFWADAKELSEKLQASPSRIDGPAKAYTLRGRYRQFFLRVTAENVDEHISANLVVKPDRTLDIVVETLPIPGTVPLPPQIPRDLRSATPESDPSSPVTAERQDFYAALPGHKHSYSRPQRSPSAWSSNRDASPRSTSHAYPSYESTRTGVSGSTVAITKTGLGKETRGYESPTSDGDPDEVHETISKAIDTIIQKDPGWVVFFRAKAAPQRVSEVLKHYRFVQRMMDEWVEKKAPFRTSHHVVEASHITRALHIDDPNYSSACTETLALLALYGPQGQRYEDSRIVAMVNDTSDPEYNAKPIKRMLHLLREIDERWKEHPPGTGSSDSAGPRGTGR